MGHIHGHYVLPHGDLEPACRKGCTWEHRPALEHDFWAYDRTGTDVPPGRSPDVQTGSGPHPVNHWARETNP